MNRRLLLAGLLATAADLAVARPDRRLGVADHAGGRAAAADRTQHRDRRRCGRSPPAAACSGTASGSPGTTWRCAPRPATRERLYRALIPARPLPQRGADLLTRMVDDTDAVQDLLVRVPAARHRRGRHRAGRDRDRRVPAPAAALVLLAGLVVAGVLLPGLRDRRGPRWSARIAPARAELAARVADLVHGAADLAAYGANRGALAAARPPDERLARLERGQWRMQRDAPRRAGMLVQGAHRGAGDAARPGRGRGPGGDRGARAHRAGVVRAGAAAAAAGRAARRDRSPRCGGCARCAPRRPR